MVAGELENGEFIGEPHWIPAVKADWFNIGLESFRVPDVNGQRIEYLALETPQVISQLTEACGATLYCWKERMSL